MHNSHTYWSSLCYLIFHIGVPLDEQNHKILFCISKGGTNDTV